MSRVKKEGKAGKGRERGAGGRVVESKKHYVIAKGRDLFKSSPDNYYNVWQGTLPLRRGLRDPPPK
jgi:hypothetical protein